MLFTSSRTRSRLALTLATAALAALLAVRRDRGSAAPFERCNIARRAATGPLPLHTQHPYIVRLGHRNAELRARLIRERLLADMGDVNCTPSQAGSQRKGIETMRLREYIDGWMQREVRRDSSQNKYVFGEFGDAWAPLRDAYVLPPCGPACDRTRVAVTIGLGGLHSGRPCEWREGGGSAAGSRARPC